MLTAHSFFMNKVAKSACLQNNLAGHQTDHLRDLVRLTVAALLLRLKQRWKHWKKKKKSRNDFWKTLVESEFS
jgi:histone deacetylase complex regulatory component SIN3